MSLLGPQYPRAVVQLKCLFEDQLGGAVPAFITAVPRSITIDRNSARKADTCSVELDYRDFPLDPRTLSDVLISAHLEGVLTADTPMIPNDVPFVGNLRFIGLVDEPHVSLSTNGQTVRLEARDYTGIWLDKRWGTGPEETLLTPPKTTLSALVSLMAAQVTPLLPVVFTDPTAAALDVNRATGKAVFTPDSDDESAWDVLCALCDLFALVPVFELDQLVIRTPSAPSTRTLQMVYGQNIDRLEITRNMKRNRGKQVKLVAWNPILGQAVEAVWPTAAEALALNPPKLTEKGNPTKASVKQVQYNIEGPYDPASLLVLAKRVYTELAQNQLQGELETRELGDFFGADLLATANGDVLLCQLGPEDQASVAGMSTAEAVGFLSNPMRVGALSPAAAQALMTSWSAAQNLATKFYVVEASHHWDRDGYRLKIKFRDFILGV